LELSSWSTPRSPPSASVGTLVGGTAVAVGCGVLVGRIVGVGDGVGVGVGSTRAEATTVTAPA
jgi:hypothetical protein